MSKEYPPQQLQTEDSATTKDDAAVLHIPVLLDATLRTLQPMAGESYLDLTAGYGGHAAKFIEKTGAMSQATLVDQDDFALQHLEHFAKDGARLMHMSFVEAAKQLVEEGRAFDLVVIDLGVSSPQLDMGSRGFSFQKDAPLDMRMDRRNEVTAATIVNSYSKQELIRVIMEYGEEKLQSARRIADAIEQNRPIQTTTQLADIIKQQYRGPWKRTHPATRTFQALRMEVNDEIEQIKSVLPLLPRLLKPGGRLGIISFHSLEDRLVKRYFKEEASAGYEAQIQLVTKKPILGATDDVHNPRSRSAKLRVALKK